MHGDFKLVNGSLFSEWERESWMELVEVPFRLLWFGLLYGVWILWKKVHRKSWQVAMCCRVSSPTPVLCPRCMWAGRERDMIHTYYGIGDGDVEGVNECPHCGKDI